MTFILKILAAIGLYKLYERIICEKYFAETRPDEIHEVLTADGYRLALSRYLTKSDKRAASPILMCHGTGSSSLGYDLTRDHSMARFFADHGYEVWLIDLRGHGRSHKPNFLAGERYDWGFNTHVNFDMPAAIKYVQKHSNQKLVHWLGLSKGANLIYAYLAKGGEGINTAVPIAGGLDFTGTKSDYVFLRRFDHGLQFLPRINIQLLCRLGAPFAGYFKSRIDQFLGWPDNINTRHFKQLNVHGFHPISPKVLIEQGQLFEDGGIRDENGKCYFPGLSDVTVPVFSITGNKDRQVNEVASKRAHDALKSDAKEFITFGKEYGQKEHYGHMDLIMGKNVKTEVFPCIINFLEKHDPIRDI
jgi:polyhydroxyalkanoate synthase subunit PhaC